MPYDPLESARLISEGIDAGKKRNREDEFAKWLQDQGMAPGTEIPRGTGEQFGGFLKAGGLTGFQEQQRAEREGGAYADTLDKMSQHPQFTDQQRATMGALSQGIRTGKLRPEDYRQHVNEIVKYGMMPGLPEGTPEGVLFDLDKGIKSVTRADSTGKVSRETKEMTSADKYTAYAERVNKLNAQARSRSLTSEETEQLTRDSEQLNLLRPLVMVPGAYQVPVNPSAPTMARSGVPENAPPGAIRGVPPVETPAEVKEMGSFNAYATRITELARDVKNRVGMMDPTERAKYQSLLRVYRLDPTGLLRTVYPLPDDIAQLDYRMNQALTEFELHRGGMRAVSGPQIQAQMTSLHGGTIMNPNAPIALDEIAKSFQFEAAERNRAAQMGGRRHVPGPLPARPAEVTGPTKTGEGTAPTAPTQPSTAVTGGAAGVSGTPFGRWKASQGAVR